MLAIFISEVFGGDLRVSGYASGGSLLQANVRTANWFELQKICRDEQPDQLPFRPELQLQFFMSLAECSN